jgi:hypothetical protein
MVARHGLKRDIGAGDSVGANAALARGSCAPASLPIGARPSKDDDHSREAQRAADEIAKVEPHAIYGSTPQKAHRDEHAAVRSVDPAEFLASCCWLQRLRETVTAKNRGTNEGPPPRMPLANSLPHEPSSADLEKTREDEHCRRAEDGDGVPARHGQERSSQCAQENERNPYKV